MAEFLPRDPALDLLLADEPWSIISGDPLLPTVSQAMRNINALIVPPSLPSQDAGDLQSRPLRT
jgi:hypothetical protein